MAYIRKPDGEKRGKGNSRKGTIGPQKSFPIFPTSISTIVDDRPAVERHIQKLAQLYKHSRPNKQVSTFYV